MKRRKIKPTHMERTLFGEGSGKSLNNVVELAGIGRVGALSCWEHAQPLLKYHTMSLREQIHVAAWPPLHPFDENGGGLCSMSAEGMWVSSEKAGSSSRVLIVYRRRSTSSSLRNRELHIRAALHSYHHNSWHIGAFDGRQRSLRTRWRWKLRCLRPRWKTIDKADTAGSRRHRLRRAANGLAGGHAPFC